MEKTDIEEDGWIPIEYCDLIALIVEGTKIVLTSENMQLYYKVEEKSR